MAQAFNVVIAASITSIAAQYVGQGNNPAPGANPHDYPIANEAEEWIGIPIGEDECASFACFMAHKANVLWNSAHSPAVEGPVTASTGAIHDWGLSVGNVVSYADCREGDLILFKGNTDTGYQHTAIIRHNEGPTGTLLTIEADHTPGVIFNTRVQDDWDAVASFVRPYVEVK